MIRKGVKIPNARVGLGRTRAFTLKAAARPQSGQKRAGKKERVLGEGIFACEPKRSPAVPRFGCGNRSRKISFSF